MDILFVDVLVINAGINCPSISITRTGTRTSILLSLVG
jgi:hypothetical protein